MAGKLLYTGPSLTVLHDAYARRGRIDDRAPLVSSSSLVVDASPARVWAVMTDLASWAGWATGIRVLEAGEVRPGERFRWRLNGITLRSRFAVVEPERELIWTGTFLVYRAVDRHVLEPLPGGRTRVTVEESLAGPFLPLMYGPARLRANHERWLNDLAAAVQRQPRGSSARR
ncbi:SRPBCC domain-containing protein [Microbispora sp. ATCC PTA-5024]|uniref:SRPBCC domain-containing protein n=1 Tax=Microbispora sp. ATCC PTA-5024 TaxID=316330 RepID=UPI0003DD83E8|nr:SRPBCC domain-containing protein [Microbispora sp. ATCC PTA-5024]ETK35993.1 heat-shock protein Hsp90 [Microbispora sp. ATCC PTA-5024]